MCIIKILYDKYIMRNNILYYFMYLKLSIILYSISCYKLLFWFNAMNINFLNEIHVVVVYSFNYSTAFHLVYHNVFVGVLGCFFFSFLLLLPPLLLFVSINRIAYGVLQVSMKMPDSDYSIFFYIFFIYFTGPSPSTKVVYFKRKKI